MNLVSRFDKYCSILLFFLLLHDTVYAQSNNAAVSEIKKAMDLSTSSVDTAKTKLLKLSLRRNFLHHDKVRVYLKLSELEIHSGNFKQALHYALMALKFAESSDHKKDIADAHFQIGMVYKSLNLELKAADYYTLASREYLSFSDKQKHYRARMFQAHVLTDYGLNKRNFNYFLSAEKIYVDVLELAKKDKNVSIEMISYNNLANLNLKRFSADSSKLWLNKCRSYAQKIIEKSQNSFDSLNYAVAISNYAESYILELKMDSATRYYNKAFAFFSKEKNPDLFYYNSNRLIEGYLALHNLIAADSVLENYRLTFEENQDFAEYASYYKQKATLESKRGNYRAAYELRLKYSTFMENIREDESAKELVRLQFLYDLEKKNKEIEILNRNKKLQAENVRNSVWIRNLLILGVLLLLSLSLFIYLRYREKVKNTLIVISKNEELERLSIVARSTSNAITIANSSGDITWINDGYKKLYGWESKEALIAQQGNNIFDHCGLTRAEIAQYIEDVRHSKNSVIFQTFKELRSGEQKFIQTNLTPVFNVAGEMDQLVFVETDITELLDAREIALKEKRKAEYALKTQELFLANVSHEIRTPMNGIIGLTRQLQEEVTSEKHQDITQSILISADSLLHVVNDLLDVSKIRARKMSIETTGFSLLQLVNDFKKSIRHRALEKGLDFTIQIDQQIVEHVLGDPIRLNQILLNLVGNAIKFTMEGRVALALRLIENKDEVQKIQFSISDTGIGIPQTKKDLVFDHFVQLEDHRTRTISGTGLGLGISKTLVEAMGGVLHLNSQEGVGTTVTFELPFAIDLKLEPQFEKIHDVVLHKDLSGLRVLLVEDNSINQKVIVNDLKKWHCTVSVVSDAFEAIEILKNEAFDVVLMDYYMPRMDGIETTNYIRTKFAEPIRSVPIIAITASAMQGDNDKFIQAGMNDYISKPFNPEKLYHLLVKWGFQSNSKSFDEEQHVVHVTSRGVFDFELLNERAEGDSNYLIEMFQAFLEMIPQYQQEFMDCYEQGNWDALRKSAHQLLSPCKLFGMHETAELLLKIEKDKNLLRNDMATTVTQVNELLFAGCAELRVLLDDLVKGLKE